MGNYIKSELFRLSKSKVLWGLIAIMSFWFVVSSVSMQKGYFLKMLGNSMIIPYILTGIIGLVVVADGYKSGTLKNDLAYGISENKNYFSKIVVSIIVGAIMFVIVDLVAIPIACLFNGKENIKYISMLLQAEGVMFVACVASVVCFMTVYFITKKSIVSAFIWYGLAVGIDTILLILMVDALEIYDFISKFMLSYVVKNAYYINERMIEPWFKQEGIINIVISSAIMIVLCVVCKLVIKKKEK